jgi:hypothetical protein
VWVEIFKSGEKAGLEINESDPVFESGYAFEKYTGYGSD